MRQKNAKGARQTAIAADRLWSATGIGPERTKQGRTCKKNASSVVRLTRYCYNEDMEAVSSEIFRRVIEPDKGTLSPELARFVLDLDFRGPDHTRFESLSEKAQSGSLAPHEAEELDGYLHVDSLLTILRLKAERSLNTGNGRH